MYNDKTREFGAIFKLHILQKIFVNKAIYCYFLTKHRKKFFFDCSVTGLFTVMHCYDLFTLQIIVKNATYENHKLYFIKITYDLCIAL